MGCSLFDRAALRGDVHLADYFMRLVWVFGPFLSRFCSVEEGDTLSVAYLFSLLPSVPQIWSFFPPGVEVILFGG